LRVSRVRDFAFGFYVARRRADGFTDDGAYVLDTAGAGNANAGHAYGSDLSAGQRRDLIEYLKTL